MVSNEVRPTNQCTRIAKRRLIETDWAYGVTFGLEGGFAGPQSPDFGALARLNFEKLLPFGTFTSCEKNNLIFLYPAGFTPQWYLLNR